MKQILLTAGVAFLVSGCVSRALVCSPEPHEAVSLADVGGQFLLTKVEADYVKTEPRGCGEALSDWLVAESPKAAVFRPSAEQESVPVTLKVAKTQIENNNGVLAGINNFFAVVTLNIWPAYHSKRNDYTVTAHFKKSNEQVTFSVEESSLTSWLPLALCPVPTKADSRVREEFSTVEDQYLKTKTLSLFTKTVYDKNAGK